MNNKTNIKHSSINSYINDLYDLWLIINGYLYENKIPNNILINATFNDFVNFIIKHSNYTLVNNDQKLLKKYYKN